MIRADIDNPDLPLTALFRDWPVAAAVFGSHGMVCFCCPVAPFHTVIDACREYERDEAEFRDELHVAISAVQTRGLARPRRDP